MESRHRPSHPEQKRDNREKGGNSSGRCIGALVVLHENREDHL